MTDFHCILHIAPNEFPSPIEYEIQGIRVIGTKLPSVTTRFSQSFEGAANCLQNLSRFFFEPDGSFVWVKETADQRYQLDGSLYDDGERLLHVELKGSCDHAMLDSLLACLGQPFHGFLFQFVQNGIYLLESEFRQHFVA